MLASSPSLTMARVCRTARRENPAISQALDNRSAGSPVSADLPASASASPRAPCRAPSQVVALLSPLPHQLSPVELSVPDLASLLSRREPSSWPAHRRARRACAPWNPRSGTLWSSHAAHAAQRARRAAVLKRSRVFSAGAEARREHRVDGAATQSKNMKRIVQNLMI